MAPRCYYRVLQVPRTASDKEIRASFLLLAKQRHPDVNQRPGAAEEFRLLHEAYSALKTAEKRSFYDHQQMMDTNGVSYPSSSSGFKSQNHDPDTKRRPFSTADFNSSHSRRDPLFVPITTVGVSLLILMVLFRLPDDSSNDKIINEFATKSDRYNIKNSRGKVDAWWNPSSKRWETPAPWDPLYTQNKSSLSKVERRYVHSRDL